MTGLGSVNGGKLGTQRTGQPCEAESERTGRVGSVKTNLSTPVVSVNHKAHAARSRVPPLGLWPMKPAPTQSRPGRPEGGFRIISTRQLCAAWAAYRLGLLGGYLGLRVYLALHEIAQRRQAAACRRSATTADGATRSQGIALNLAELNGLVGGAGGRCLRQSVRSLSATGLVRCNGQRITLVDDPLATASPALQAAVQAMLSCIHPRPCVRERPLAVPRRLLRYLARPGCPAVAATLLGHALRCLWRRGGVHRMVGSCSAEFVARVFGMHVRTVKAARCRLQAEGWLRSVPAPHWHVQRFGGRWAITPPVARRRLAVNSTAGTESPPPPPCRDTETPPPETQRTLPSEVQQPGPAVRRGLASAAGGKGRRAADLRHVQVDDLRDDDRLLRLLRLAVGRRWLSDSEADRLRGFAAAEHALRVGTYNPAGLFVWMLRRRCWSFITAADEDGACARRRRHETGRETEQAQASAGGDAVAALVGRTATALSLTSRLEREKACTASAKPEKNTAVDSSPQPEASSVIACMASSTNSTFSASAARNATSSNPSMMLGEDRVSMPRACHTRPAWSRGIRPPRPNVQRIRRKTRSGNAAAA